VLAVIERGKISKPLVIGHSMAGDEMTTLARNHCDRVSGLLYMDALGDLEDDPLADPEWLALQKKVPTDLRPQPKSDPVDKSTLAVYQKSMACRLGFLIPESELRNQAEDVKWIRRSREGTGLAVACDWPAAGVSARLLEQRCPSLRFWSFQSARGLSGQERRRTRDHRAVHREGPCAGRKVDRQIEAHDAWSAKGKKRAMPPEVYPDLGRNH
jgi:pimeloyl-ACP methyl ester carboxylesterase